MKAGGLGVAVLNDGGWLRCFKSVGDAGRGSHSCSLRSGAGCSLLGCYKVVCNLNGIHGTWKAQDCFLAW